MNIGSVSWELTVGASGGQPQVYTSLCLFKLKCLFKNFFFYFSLHHTIVYTLYKTPELPLFPQQA